MAQIIVLLGRDVFGQHVKRCPRKILPKAFDGCGKQSGIHYDGRANTQVARVRLLDEFYLLEALPHCVEHRDSEFEQRAAVMRRLDP